MKTRQVENKWVNTLLWSLQALLAITFLWGGYVKLFLPTEQLNKMWPWTVANSALVSFAGVADTLAGIGIIFPRLLKISPGLTLYSCYGIIVLMTAAIVFHVARGEVSQIGINFAVILMATVTIFLWKYLIKYQ